MRLPVHSADAPIRPASGANVHLGIHLCAPPVQIRSQTETYAVRPLSAALVKLLSGLFLRMFLILNARTVPNICLLPDVTGKNRRHVWVPSAPLRANAAKLTKRL